jgi:hypothetical protein
VMKHGSLVHLTAAAEDPVRTLIAVPAILCKGVHIMITASSFTIQHCTLDLQTTDLKYLWLSFASVRKSWYNKTSIY